MARMMEVEAELIRRTVIAARTYRAIGYSPEQVREHIGVEPEASFAADMVQIMAQQQHAEYHLFNARLAFWKEREPSDGKAEREFLIALQQSK